MKQSQILVVAGIIEYAGKILITQRSIDSEDLQPGLWEFPGGKVEFGEDPRDALIREIKEELNLEISDINLYQETSGIFNKPDQAIHAIMLVYQCKTMDPNLDLVYHNDYKWITLDQINNYKWAKLDIPVIENLIRTNV